MHGAGEPALDATEASHDLVDDGGWTCPACDRPIPFVHRPGRPRLYCSHACRQRVYRWRRRHRVHTEATPTWPVESAAACSHAIRSHALRSRTDPISRCRDRRNREVTVCGLLAHPRHAVRRNGDLAPFLPGGANCRVCSALTEPRPHGLVPPGAMPPAVDISDVPPDFGIEQLRRIDPAWPLSRKLRDLLDTIWRPSPQRRNRARHDSSERVRSY